MAASFLQNRRILLGVTGGISAYKSAELCRMLIRQGAKVRVIMTRSATEFVRPLTFETLSGHPVYVDMFDKERSWEIEHIAFARWGEALVVAPATANSIAKMAGGFADDPLSTTFLAFRGPVVVAPAMNTAMWQHRQTESNLQKLLEQGVALVAPESGNLACGEEGAGRLAPPEKIVEALTAALSNPAHGDLAGKSVLITAGPTVEPIDPVRHLSNPSSGRMGYALAAEALHRGARVTLVSGPVSLQPPQGLHQMVAVQTAQEMEKAVLEQQEGQDYCLFTAAVADYRPAEPAEQKMKKHDQATGITLELVPNPDVALAAKKQRRPGQTFVGFAAETDNLVDNMRDKMRRKGFDIVVGNQVDATNPAFGAVENAVTLLAATGGEAVLPRTEKAALASSIWDFVLAHPRRET